MNPLSLSSLPPELQGKIAACQEILRKHGRILVGFSAGVDSTFLVALATQTLGPQNVLAGMAISPSLPQRERQYGHDLARQIGVELLEVQTEEMDDPHFAQNPSDRCFYCKTAVFSVLRELGSRRGFGVVASGANADDTGDFRPGLQAGEQLGVANPLLEAGLTKDDIRAASRAMGLPTWDKPAMACLASRVPYGRPITAGKLARIERAEYLLQDLGFRQCRVRDHDTVARIEVPVDGFQRLWEHRGRIVESLKALGYTYVTLDLQGFRSGSMNETLDPRE